MEPGLRVSERPRRPRRLAAEADRGFAVSCDGAAEPVRRVLEVTGLAEELPVHPNREAALEALAVAT